MDISPWATELISVLNQDTHSSKREAWRGLLYQRFRDRSLPLLVSEPGTIPAASMWTGSRIWLDIFRELQLQPGDRVVIALPPSPAFIQVLIAGIWLELTLVFAPDTVSADSIIQQVDARCIVAFDQSRHSLVPNGVEGAVKPLPQLRKANSPPTPEARFFLNTSGTTGSPRWIALSDRNILSVLAHHMPKLDLEGARVLSILPWNHAFGLIIDMMCALFSGAEIIRDPYGGRNPEHILKLAQEWDITHFSAVPLTLKKLIAHEGGASFLTALKGGVVGGAPVSKSLASFLRKTHLRTGYGQTEASPGISLGEPGIWQANTLGKPLGCAVKTDEHCQLYFRGSNASLGFWKEDQLHVLDPERWVPTGDRIMSENGLLIYRGRMNDRFKLDNGRMVEAGIWETMLKESDTLIEDALLFTQDGESLNLLIRTINDQQEEIEKIKACLGSLSKLLKEVYLTPEEDWVRTPKGDIAREATIHALIK